MIGIGNHKKDDDDDDKSFYKIYYKPGTVLRAPKTSSALNAMKCLCLMYF